MRCPFILILLISFIKHSFESSSRSNEDLSQRGIIDESDAYKKIKKLKEKLDGLGFDNEELDDFQDSKNKMRFLEK